MLTINTGFLTGNQFSNWDSEELAQIDAAASIRRYADMVEEAILAAFPGSEVTVVYQDGEGSEPYAVQTRVSDESGNDDDDAVLSVNEIASDIFIQGEWVVENA